MKYLNKYLKYKKKYLKLKNQIGGNDNSLKLDEEITEDKIYLFKSKLDERTRLGLKNWLVIYAAFYKDIEKIRFKNPNWIFWDLRESFDDRLGIVGDFNKENLELLSENLKESFDYICFDDNLYYNPTNNEAFISQLLNFLKPSGFLVIENIINQKENEEDDISKKILIEDSISTPFGLSKSNQTILIKILDLIKYNETKKLSIDFTLYPNIKEIIKKLFLEVTGEDFFSNNCSIILNIEEIKEKITPEICQRYFENFNEIKDKIEDKDIETKLTEEYTEIINLVTDLWELPSEENKPITTVFTDEFGDEYFISKNELMIIKK
jgi:SAM-dependent methyltransferase